MAETAPSPGSVPRTQNHSWSYEVQPRQATERQCRKCGLECRRPGAGSGWTGAGIVLEYRFPGHEWEKVEGYPVCGGRLMKNAVARRAGT